ncbi:site-specific integrase [Pokkaliibacter sp. CJK22405]|uniref:site-specific integrase n=1 Tax=Pokkaliibacter sp. CJK22405 TaxID=3384615 RepID=UPI003984A7D5
MLTEDQHSVTIESIKFWWFMNIHLMRFRGENGERFSVLNDKDGMPLFYPTLFATWTLRGSSLAANSITNTLNALKLLLVWEFERELDLESNFRNGKFLNYNQIRDLCDFLQKSIARKKYFKTFSINRSSKKVDVSVHYFRITTAAKYLQFLAYRVSHSAVERDIEKMVVSIKAHRPCKPNKSSIDRDEVHLSDEVIHAIEAALRPGAPDNPARNRGIQLRNALIFFLLKHTGIRRGELLNLRISDINFGDCTMTIVRRPDSTLDTRKFQPTAKTRPRRIRIATSLVENIADYIKEARRYVPGARKHDYLFVTHKAGPSQGAPMSIGAFGKWMVKISCIVKESKFHAHSLRHNWNYQFSRLAEEKGMSAAEEERIRSYFMGWSETSGTAATYNRRHIKEKAQIAGLELQKHYIDFRKNSHEDM